ncbi:MAG: hypothetical protein UD936_01435 [Acutalibacteraceae bacterium]|nr:hypothetical protein [Acutalibacteraceae bacterium]
MKTKNIKSKVRIIQSILPWLILICGVPAIICYAKYDFVRLEIFYKTGMLTGVLSITAELVIGVVFLISAIVSAITKKNGRFSVWQKVGTLAYSVICSIGTLLLMLLLLGLTYAQGV